MLKDNLNCTTKRVGKHKLSVFVVARFDKKEETYKPKTFRKEIIDSSNGKAITMFTNESSFNNKQKYESNETRNK